MKPAEAYRWLLDYSTTTALYESMKSLLNWDQRTYLPKGGHSHRAQQIAAITALLHRRATDPELAEMLARVEASEIPGDLYPMKLLICVNGEETTTAQPRLPEALAVELAKAASQGELAWQSFRHENDWKGFLPYLKQIITLKRQEAAALSTGGEEIYDALIENFEPGENAKEYRGTLRQAGGRYFRIARKNRSRPPKTGPHRFTG